MKRTYPYNNENQEKYTYAYRFFHIYSDYSLQVVKYNNKSQRL